MAIYGLFFTGPLLIFVMGWTLWAAWRRHAGKVVAGGICTALALTWYTSGVMALCGSY
jgi:uncharacterized membrane protein